MSEDPTPYNPYRDETRYVGIDNGLDGGISEIGGKFVLYARPMPTVKQPKGRIVDVEIIAVSAQIWKEQGSTVILEEASKHSPGKLALCSTWDSFASIRTVLTLAKVRFIIVRPQEWQREFWKQPRGVKVDTKISALAAAKRLWPDETWLASQRCSVPNHNLVDAALIAEYGRRKGL